MTRIARQLYKPGQLHPKLDMLSKEVKLASSMISSLVAMLDCGPIHREYMGALHAVCEMALLVTANFYSIKLPFLVYKYYFYYILLLVR